MKTRLLVICAVLLFSVTCALYAAEGITKADYIKTVVQSMGWDSDKIVTPQDYVNVLVEKGVDVDAKNLNKPITPDEKSVIITEVINVKLQKKAKTPHGIENKAIVDDVMGEVSALIKGDQNWIPAKTGMKLGLNDKVKTGPASYVSLRVGKFGRVTVKENSELLLSELGYKADRDTENIILNLAMGEAVVDCRDLKEGSRFEVRTPTTIAAVRGTVYSVKVVEEEDKTLVE